MTTPHVHATLIKAWADGAKIQFRRNPMDTWQDIEDCKIGWYPECYYRIKPEKKWFRVALFNSCTGKYTTSTHYLDKELSWPHLPEFIKWLTPRIEYEE